MSPGQPKIDSGKLAHWLFRIRVEDQPGIMAAIAATFSRRGIQVENFNGTGAAITLGDEDAEGVVLTSFKAYGYRMNSLQRVLSRLQQVKQVDVFNLDEDVQVLKTATVHTRGTSEEVKQMLTEVAAQLTLLFGDDASQVVILHGSVAAVDQAMALLQAQQQVRACDYTLVPTTA